jgi:hypothetical protein
MALFSLTDIKINNIPDGFVSDRLVGSQYDYNTHKYPIDLGSPDKAHYMVIHINEQRKTQFPSQVASDLPSVIQNQQTLGAKTGLENINGALRSASNTLSQTLNLPQSLTLDKNNDVRTIRRTTDTIALYMPDTLNFTYNQEYSTTNIEGIAAVGAAAVDAFKQYQRGNKSNIVENIGAFLGNKAATTILGQGTGTAIAQNLTGLAVNPQLELIYSSPRFRDFRFDFMFYPRSTQEAKEVQKIISRLRFHQAPEIKEGFGAFFLVPPSEFDIKFYYNGRENLNVPKISTCVLTTIDTDYAPNGWASYERPGEFDPSLGGTGMPVAIRLSLGFQEVEFMTKNNYNSMEKTLAVSDLNLEL